MNKKYELTNETIEHHGTVLHRIKALKDFGDVKAGDLGGFIESENNLSHKGNCWVFGDSIVKDEAKVLDNVTVFDNAQVLDHAIVKDYAIVADYTVVTGYSKVYEYARVYGNAKVNETSEVYGYASVRDNAILYSTAKVFGNAIVSGNAAVGGNSKVYERAIIIENAIINGTSEVHGYAIVGGNADVAYANIYNYAKVTDGVIIGSTINGDTLIDTHVYLKDNAYISSASDYFSITMNDIMATFYLSKDKDIYFSFRNHEYKLDDLNSYSKDLNNIAAFQMLVELAKNYFVKGA